MALEDQVEVEAEVGVDPRRRRHPEVKGAMGIRGGKETHQIIQGMVVAPRHRKHRTTRRHVRPQSI